MGVSNLQPAVAQLITKDLKVEIQGNTSYWTDDAKKKGGTSKFHTGKLVKMDDASGRYEVELDSIVWNGAHPKKKRAATVCLAQNFAFSDAVAPADQPGGSSPPARI